MGPAVQPTPRWHYLKDPSQVALAEVRRSQGWPHRAEETSHLCLLEVAHREEVDVLDANGCGQMCEIRAASSENNTQL